MTGARVSGPTPDAPFEGLRTDDRSRTGDLFVAIRGTLHDSHRAIPGLPGTGVRGVVAEEDAPPGHPLPWFRVADSRRALAQLEQTRWGEPATALRTFAVTGTNGKSSTVRIIAEILAAAGEPTGWITTVTSSLGAGEVPSTMTTPGPSQLAARMAEFVASGGRALALEVSSHALVQSRIAGIECAGAGLTNLSRDHLDYHGDRRSYRDAKLLLGDALAPGAPWVLPATDEFRDDLPATRGTVLRHALRPEDLLAGERGGVVRSAEFDASGIRAELEVLGERLVVRSPLQGRHNLENILVAATVARGAGIEPDAIVEGLARARAVRGRLEEVPGARGRVFVDYAHTPDALDAVLASLAEWRTGRLIVVFGCGGDRDRGKRPEMGAAAARHADVVVVTSDNPRTEDPAAIIEDVLRGIDATDRVVVEPDRRAAIGRALSELREDDVLVVAGKGHETEQIVGDERRPFDDRAVIVEWLEGAGDR